MTPPAGYPTFTPNRRLRISLGQGLSLVSAPERAFGIHYALYRNANPEFEDFLEYGADLEGLNHCFWVLRQNRKIGGIIIRPNHIEGLFLIPPRADAVPVLEAVLPLLHHWSDKTRAIEATDVLPQEREAYEGVGFAMTRGRRVYARPTEHLDVRWDGAYRTASPTPAHAADLARLFHASFSEYPPGWELGGLSEDGWLARVQNLVRSDLADVCRQASTLVFSLTRRSTCSSAPASWGWAGASPGLATPTRACQ